MQKDGKLYQPCNQIRIKPLLICVCVCFEGGECVNVFVHALIVKLFRQLPYIVFSIKEKNAQLPIMYLQLQVTIKGFSSISLCDNVGQNPELAR